MPSPAPVMRMRESESPKSAVYASRNVWEELGSCMCCSRPDVTGQKQSRENSKKEMKIYTNKK